MSMNFNSHFSKDLENMIRLKVSLGGAESTYLDRAQNFDRFCLEKYPDADRLTEPLALSWIRESSSGSLPTQTGTSPRNFCHRSGYTICAIVLPRRS